MAKKVTLNYDVKKMLQDTGIDYSDFLSYLNRKSDNQDQVYEDKEQYTVLRVIDMFIINLNKSELLDIKSPNTAKYYLSFFLRFKQFIDKYHKELLFIDLNELIFYDFINEIYTEKKIKLTHSSINTYIRIIKRLSTFAEENDYCSKNISYKFNLISYSTLPRYYSHVQITNILKTTDEHKKSLLWRTIFITLLGTGLRISELANLKIKDFDIEQKLIYTLGKGKKERYVPIYPMVNDSVLHYLQSTGVTNLSFAQDGYLFSNIYGYERNKPISIRTIQRNFHNIAKKLELDDRFTIHSFRHTFAVNCLKGKMGIPFLCQILGHSDPKSTFIYTQLLPQDLQIVIDEKFPFPLEQLIKEILSEEQANEESNL